ncbi:hypothetical protein LguiA_000080 [Lonicera macranthoides]
MGSNKMDRELKYLGFIKVIAINAVICLWKLYEYAKLKSGPFKSTIGTVESLVTAIVGPFYDRAKVLPDDVLLFLDNKVNEATYKFDEQAPPLAKQVVSQVHSIVHKSSEIALSLAQEAKSGGPIAAIHYAGTVFKQSVPRQLAMVLYAFDKIPPPFDSMARNAAPAFANWSDTYNRAIKGMAAKGYTFFNHLPLVPIDEIAEEFNKLVDAREQHNSDTTTSAGTAIKAE